jgi:hypothetical protein
MNGGDDSRLDFLVMVNGSLDNMPLNILFNYWHSLSHLGRQLHNYTKH